MYKPYSILLPLMLVFLSRTMAQTPSNNQNYVMESTYRTFYDLGSVGQVNRTIKYIDGLGRPQQIVQWQASPSGKDLVQLIAYDAYGREAVKYLPYADQNSIDGSYKASGIANQGSFYTSPTAGVGVNQYPYGVTEFELSPLNRILKQGAPGGAWQPGTGDDHSRKIVYNTNDANDAVKLWTINSNGAVAGTYQSAKLYKITNRDENWKTADGRAGTSEEFKDFEGKIILKRVWESNVKSLSTYYVYDDLGNLRYVLPPAVNENGQSPLSSFEETDLVFNQFIYGYHYDGRRRLVEKKIPGKVGWESLIYNKLNQVVLTQNPKQGIAGQWLFAKYDVKGRLIITGIYASTALRSSLQASLDAMSVLWETRDNTDASGSATGYTNLAFPQGSIVANNLINYYDDYDFYGNTFGGPDIPPVGPVLPGEDAEAPVESRFVSGDQVRGLLTGSKVRNLGSGVFLLTVNYFDQKGMVAQSIANNHLGGTDVIDNTYSFVGELTASTRSHIVNGIVTNIATRYEYDHVGRRTNTYQKIYNSPQTDGTEVLLSHLEYNEIGQLRYKKLNNQTQSTEFTYNERGWLKKSLSTQFSTELKYNDGDYPQFNGNIANQYWGTGSSSFPNNFTYRYDNLNRLTSGISTGIALSETVTYDEMGNIKTLNRQGTGNNQYNYEGNKLLSVDNVTGLYAYDENGNAKTDGKNGATVNFNYLNLPQTVTKGSVVMQYVYDAIGNKLSRTVNGDRRDYVAGIEYRNGVLELIHTEEGVARKSGASYVYEYNLIDHLGNVRYTFNQNGSALQKDDYFAFGKRNTSLLNATDNKYLYNGKELQEELVQYDYGARFYDPVIGRWNVVDPLAEGYFVTSPYVYVENNPIGFVDPTGMYKVDANGNIAINDRDEILNFTNFLKSNRNASYNDITNEVFSAGNGYSYDLNEITVKKKSAWIDEVHTQQANASALVSGAFAMGEMLSYSAAAEISATALSATGAGAAIVAIGLGAYKANQMGFEIDGRPFAQSVLGLPSMSDTNGLVFSKGGHRNIWPDQYGYPPNVNDVNWRKGDQQLADSVSDNHNDTKKGQGTPNGLTRKWFRDKRPKK